MPLLRQVFVRRRLNEHSRQQAADDPPVELALPRDVYGIYPGRTHPLPRSGISWGILYTVEVIQAAYYYRHFKHDNWMLKLLVSSAIAIDSVSMIANYASIYLVTQSLTGEIWRIWRTSIGQPDPLYLFTTGVVAALTQSFLTVRYWLLTKNKFITLTLFVFITVATGGAFASAVTITIFPQYKDRAKATIPATCVIISSENLACQRIRDGHFHCVVWEFRKVKSSFKETRSLRDRLVAQTIQTGAAGATVALAVLVAFLANKESNGEFLGLSPSIPGSHIPVPTGIAYCLGRVYCLTMLANLNVRKTGNTWLSKCTISGANPEIRGERGNQARSEGDDDYSGIHVHRTAVVYIETPQEFSMGPLKTNAVQDLPDDSPDVKKKMAVNDPASYSSDNKQDLFVA
ncbi:hypothetical protein C8R44DRAFT_891290 [Mycena epipterygia]|nr:hypothetical protein C8R44DRAFT_891290 [Mycena epipterygia]